MSWDPYASLEKKPSFQVRSNDVKEGEKLDMPHVSGIFGSGGEDHKENVGESQGDEKRPYSGVVLRHVLEKRVGRGAAIGPTIDEGVAGNLIRSCEEGSARRTPVAAQATRLQRRYPSRFALRSPAMGDIMAPAGDGSDHARRLRRQTARR